MGFAPSSPPKPAQFEPMPLRVLPHRPCPLRAGFRPRGNDHRLDGAAGVGHSEGRVLGADGDSKRGTGDVWPGPRDPAELAQRIAVVDCDEVPGLAVRGAAGEVGGVDDAARGVGRDGLVPKLADGEQGADGVKDFHGRASFWG